MLKKLLILLLIPHLLCSCTNKKPEEITFSSWGSVTEVNILNKIINDFEKENPTIKVKFIHVPQNYFQKLHLLFAANQPPDVIFINNLYLPLYADYLKEAQFEKKYFYKQSYQALSYNGVVYAVPRDISNPVFYYNQELVSIPKHWQMKDFLSIIQNAKGKYKVSYERDMYWAKPYILTLGEKEGIDFYKNLEGTFAPKPSQIGSSTLGQMFINGEIAIYLSGRWMYPKIKECAKFTWNIAPFPGVVPADASGWAITKNTKHPESAQRFIDYLSSSNSIDYFTETGLIIPARIDSAKKIENSSAFLKAIENSVPNCVDKEYRKNTDMLNKKLFN